MYRISKNVRKYSSTPIVRVFIDEHGKEQEEIVLVATCKKTQGDLLSLQIVELLNQNGTYVDGYLLGFSDGANDRCPQYMDKF